MATAKTEFTWHIVQLERETKDGFIFTAHYAVDAEDGTYKTGAYGSIGFERPDALIPYSNLDEATVLTWIFDALGEGKKEEVEAALQSQLDELRTPSKAQGLPWS